MSEFPVKQEDCGSSEGENQDLGDKTPWSPDILAGLTNSKEKKNVLKELGCRLKSVVYLKSAVSRKDVLELFRSKNDRDRMARRKAKSVLYNY